MSDSILVERNGGVVTIQLNRPDEGNAFTREMDDRLHQEFAAMDADDSVRAIVVTGSGRFFCTGASLKSGGSFDVTEGDAMTRERAARAARIKPWTMSTPIIAAMNGAAVGYGLTLPLQWDIRIVAEDAKYGFVFNSRGVMPEAGSLWLLPRLIGVSRAMELLLTARIFRGKEAVDLGLASRALPADEVLPAAQEIAHEIAASTAPLSTRLTKELVYRFLTDNERERAGDQEWEIFRWLGRQPDAAEGVQSFLDKRAPKWTISKNTSVPGLRPESG